MAGFGFRGAALLRRRQRPRAQMSEYHVHSERRDLWRMVRNPSRTAVGEDAKGDSHLDLPIGWLAL